MGNNWKRSFDKSFRPERKVSGVYTLPFQAKSPGFAE